MSGAVTFACERVQITAVVSRLIPNYFGRFCVAVNGTSRISHYISTLEEPPKAVVRSVSWAGGIAERVRPLGHVRNNVQGDGALCRIREKRHTT